MQLCDAEGEKCSKTEYCKCSRCCDCISTRSKESEGKTSTSSTAVSKWDEEGIERSIAAARSKYLAPNTYDQHYLNFDRLMCRRKSGQVDTDQFLIQYAVKTFLRTLLNGIVLEVVADNGSTIATDCSVDFEMRAIYLSVQSVKRRILLEEIEAVLSSEELSRIGIVTSNEAYLNQCCTTLVIKDEQFLTFKFDTVRMRKYFEVCLQALIVARMDGAE